MEFVDLIYMQISHLAAILTETISAYKMLTVKNNNTWILNWWAQIGFVSI